MKTAGQEKSKALQMALDVVDAIGEAGLVTVPAKPIRHRLKGSPPFVVTRGGEYCFAPGLRALRWLAELET